MGVLFLYIHVPLIPLVQLGPMVLQMLLYRRGGVCPPTKTKHCHIGLADKTPPNLPNREELTKNGNVSLTLICWFIVLTCSYYVLFDAKRTKNFCTRKVYSQVLFVHDASDHSVKHLFVMVAYGLFAGCCGTRFTRVWGIIYTRVTLKHPRTMACNLHRLPLNTLTVQVSPLATSYLC